ncbi:hypothetical protein H671_5g14156 [Cricetulus griseus]|nr:hypothetical protein H671_5g14156 [Cricetulus griseus]
MARLSSKCVLRLASLNVKPQNSPGLCAEPNVYAEIAQAHPSAVQSLGPPSCPVDDSDQVCSSSASPACEGLEQSGSDNQTAKGLRSQTPLQGVYKRMYVVAGAVKYT